MNRIGDLHGLRAGLQLTGRDEGKRVLEVVYSDLRKGLFVTTEVVSGYDAVLLGNLSVQKPMSISNRCPYDLHGLQFKGQDPKYDDRRCQPVIVNRRVRNAAEVGAATS